MTWFASAFYVFIGSGLRPFRINAPNEITSAAGGGRILFAFVAQCPPPQSFWFRNRDKAGLVRSWPHGGTYEVFPQSDLLAVGSSMDLGC